MNMTIKHFVRAFLFIFVGLGLSSAQALTPMQAGDILVLVRTEVSGTDNIYHYELVNKGTVKMMAFSIGVIQAVVKDPAPGDDYRRTLSRLPTNTMWVLAPEFLPQAPDMENPLFGFEVPLAAQGSITSPPGWRAEIKGLRVPGVELNAADARYSITWYAPKPVYGGPVNVTGADAGQRLAGFSVRVPRDSATGPGAVGSATNYTQGQFKADVWFGSTWLTKTEQVRRNKIIQTPALLLTFGTDIYNAYESNGEFYVETGPNTTATINAILEPLTIPNGTPLTYRLESIVCSGECAPNEGVTGAAFGTDDRMFDLATVFTWSSDYSWHYRMYDVTYSATDTAGVRATTTSRVTIASKKRR
jgi:hypothetical protein